MELSALDARILLACGHFVATCMTTAAQGMEGGVAFVIFASFGFAFLSVVAGWELFAAQKNAVHAVAHFVGGLMQARLLLQSLPHSYLWYIVLFAHVPATAASLSSLSRASNSTTTKQRMP